MLGSVTCAACGGKVREDRVRCLRCGAPLVAAAVTAPNRERPWLIVAALTIAVALAGVSAFVMRGSVRACEGAGCEGAMPDLAAVSTAPAATVAPSNLRTVAPRSASGSFEARDVAVVGVAAYTAGNAESSVDLFRRAVEIAPQDPEALNNLAQALVRIGRTRESISYFDRAIAVAPAVWAYQFNRARAFGELKEWPRAIAGYREASRLFPEDYATQFNLAKALQASGDLPAAIAAFERAIVLAPSQPDFHLSHGLALEAAARPADAAAAYQRFLELDPESAEADKVRARIKQLQS